MKKLVMVIVCTLVMILFIALNYLLWDRENKMNIDAHKDASINALGREIRNLEASNSSFKERINVLEGNIKLLEKKNEELQHEKDITAGNILQKNEIINQLKQTVDGNTFENVVLKWVDAIDKAQYESAYKLQLSQFPNQNAMTLEDFINYYKANVKNIKVTAVSMNIQGVPDEKKGDITLKVALEVKRVPNSGKIIFEEGQNEKLFTVIFSKEKNSWIIGDIQ